MLTKFEKARLLCAFFPLSFAGRLVFGRVKEIECREFSAAKYSDGEIAVFKDGYLVVVIK